MMTKQLQAALELVTDLLPKQYLQTGSGPMISERLKTRLVLREAVLSQIDRRRADTGDPNVGAAAEKRILDLELADLEKAVMSQESLEHTLARNIRPTETDL